MKQGTFPLARVYRSMLLATVSFALISTIGLGLGSGPGSASVFPKLVDGYVYDMSGTPVSGANVTVRIHDGVTTKGTHYYDSTEGSGFYTVTFEGPEWDPGDFIEITARYGSDTAQNSTNANNDPFQTVNVTLPLAIPEFGYSFGIPVLGLSVVILACLFLILGRRRR